MTTTTANPVTPVTRAVHHVQGVNGTLEAPAAPHTLAARILAATRTLSVRFSPSWFTPVMGTAIVAVALTALPGAGSLAQGTAAAAWILAAGLLLAASAAWALQATHHPTVARNHHLDPVRVHAYGAPAMGIIAVGAGAYLAGDAILPARVALGIFVTLWCIGTAMGIATATAIPYLMFTRHSIAADGAFGGWLMPVVAPMVSASTGTLLIDHLPLGQGQLNFTVALGAMFGASLIASLVITTQVWSRLMHHQVPATAMVPTAWIVLGFLGQSTTAVSLFADHTATLVGPSTASLAPQIAVLYGIPTMGFAMLWLVIVALMTVHALRRSMPFTMSWWSFTFPVGTCVTGTSALAAHTGSTALATLAVGLFTLLVALWSVTALRTCALARVHARFAWASYRVSA